MAPDKFEKYIKDKVRQREISPSENAWNRIAEQLPVRESKTRKPIVWYAIAASFIGILMVTFYFTRNTGSEQVLPATIVNSEENNQEETNTQLLKPEKEPLKMEQKEAVASGPSLTQESEQIAIIEDTEIAESTENKELEEVVVANMQEEESRVPQRIEQDADPFIESKVAEVVAEVRLLELNKEALTEAEVDSLLRKAQIELMNQRLFKADNKVDALALLNEVEAELDQSFRDQIFDRLKSGYMKVRTALADRNN